MTTAANLFGAQFGNTTPQQNVAMRDRLLSRPIPEPELSPDPRFAGQAQSATPGLVNGNPDMGFSGAGTALTGARSGVDPRASRDFRKGVARMHGVHNIRDTDPLTRVAIGEDLMGLNFTLANMANRDAQVDYLNNAMAQLTGDPLFANIYDRALNLSDSIDFDPIRNRTIANQQEAFQNLLGQANASLGSRGLGGGFGAGLFGELASDQAASLANTLGGLDVQEELMRRQFELENLNAVQGAFGSTRPFVQDLVGRTAAAIGAPIDTADNPFAGQFDAAMQVKAFREAQDQARSAGGIAGTGLNALDMGAIALAPFTGGASLLALGKTSGGGGLFGGGGGRTDFSGFGGNKSIADHDFGMLGDAWRSIFGPSDSGGTASLPPEDVAAGFAI